ncbi:MAG: NAD(P)/FAD-dependent oxidoreductase, partial [Pseudomonadota bacterium]
VSTVLAQFMPKRLSQHLCDRFGARGNLADLSDKRLSDLIDQLATWELTPTGSEGYRTAEVTLGGVDTDGLSSKTMETKTVPGLYFIGEVVDVTGGLGGYNFQWAWSSAWAAGTAIASQTGAFERAS